MAKHKVWGNTFHPPRGQGRVWMHDTAITQWGEGSQAQEFRVLDSAWKILMVPLTYHTLAIKQELTLLRIIMCEHDFWFQKIQVCR